MIDRTKTAHQPTKEFGMRGRKPKQESREPEIRAKVAKWRQTPKFSRPSLRALAYQLGTSHQLLRHYLKHWHKWEFDEYGRRRKEIWARVEAEDRSITPSEEQQVYAYSGAQASAFAHYTILEQIDKIKRKAKRGPLGWHDIKAFKIFARAGLPGAQELLQACSQDELQKERKSFAEVVKETPRGEGEAFGTWVRRILDECEKYGAKYPSVLSKEPFERYAQRSSKEPKNNLPLITPEGAKSFR